MKPTARAKRRAISNRQERKKVRKSLRYLKDQPPKVRHA
jgi:hypothetical protein